MTKQPLERTALLVVFFFAILAIIGLVALVVNGPAAPTGVQVVVAEDDGTVSVYEVDQNIAGDMLFRRKLKCTGSGCPIER